VELARSAAVEVGGEAVGDHLGVRAEEEFVAAHAFAAELPGYRGWYWAVSVARAPEWDTVTVDEVVLLPGEGALLAPKWVPWQERVRPGDLGPGDLVPPPTEDDPRLVPGYVLSDDPAVESVAWELGLGRERVLSREGRLMAAERWYAGDRGPDTAMARHAPAACDGQVVSAEFGCGAHSQAKVQLTPLTEAAEVVYDDGEEFQPAL
jgi:hypothetical protein